MHEALPAKAAQAKLLRTTRLRAGTTVVPADVTYPTDSGLLAKAVRRIAAAARRIQAAAERSRCAGARARDRAKLRLRAAQTRNEAQAVVKRITGELAVDRPADHPGRRGSGRCAPSDRSAAAAR
jgi:transposase, IS5 family